ncbi:unnamed protein product [Rotaria socialis]|uniref:Uncharacterized protein n=1 Tax=Rotaria socialis TaxID=392032 RepID=A0A820EKP5_9BILA|nr:unnamed protein product [Rotaria socialis]CAF3766991.1 unnamed protein product [Rotaria socialis]CAF4241291.1 unnamed protein product [Rotaria socialis]CAF4250132.1 unnamed protein product [Rotaria socialis]CAF4612191.1 unnamed protein product [Rotaria socialis]
MRPIYCRKYTVLTSFTADKQTANESVLISLGGEYNLTVNNRLWLRSSYTSLYTNNQWFTSKSQSLHLIDSIFKQGYDVLLEDWNEAIFIYKVKVFMLDWHELRNGL